MSNLVETLNNYNVLQPLKDNLFQMKNANKVILAIALSAILPFIYVFLPPNVYSEIELLVKVLEIDLFYIFISTVEYVIKGVSGKYKSKVELSTPEKMMFNKNKKV